MIFFRLIENEGLVKEIDRLEELLDKSNVRLSSSIDSSPFASEKSSRSASLNRRTVRAFRYVFIHSFFTVYDWSQKSDVFFQNVYTLG